MVADVARGDGEDYSTFHILKLETLEVIGEYQGKVTPDMFAQMLNQHAREFGNCMLVVENNNILDDVAYMQVKDLSKNDNEKVFIFNGWTFASDPSLTPFDHAIYDLKLLNCNNV